MMADPSVAGTRLLVAGGEPEAARSLVARLAAAGAAAVEAERDPRAAAARVAAVRPDAVVALGGAAQPLRQALDPLELDGGPPIVELVADAGAAAATDAAVERVAAALALRALRRRVDELEVVVADDAVQRSRALEAARLDALARLGRVAEYRDDNTWEHTQRVAQLAARMGSRLGLERRIVEAVRRTAPLHDIGKIAIPDQILLKPGKLTPEEFEVVKTHTVLGARVLADGASGLFAVAHAIVRSHHERWDGSGYPDGLRGEAIPIVARVVQVADVFDILTHERPHKDAWTLEDAAAEIRRGAQAQFDPRVVRAFEDLGPEVWRAPAPMRAATSVAGTIG